MKDFIVAAFSGGRSSAVMVYEMIRRGKAPDCVVFCNTGMETMQTLNFVWGFANVVLEKCGIPFHAIEFKRKETDDGNTWREISPETANCDGQVWQDYNKTVGRLPGRGLRLCTMNLKISTQGRFIADRYGLREYTCAVGLRRDEPKRIARQKEFNEKVEGILNQGRLTPFGEVPTIMPLHHWRITKDGVRKRISKWGSWAHLAKSDAHLSNCHGCFVGSAGIKEAVAVWRINPKIGRRWQEIERYQNNRNPTDVESRLIHKQHREWFGGKPAPKEWARMYSLHRGAPWVMIEKLAKEGKSDLPIFNQKDSDSDDFGCGAFCGTDL